MVKANAMKKILLLAAAIALFAGSVNAGPLQLIGLYVDSGHSVCRQDIPAPYMTFTCWVWILPSDNGMMCAEYMLSMPAWLLSIGTVANPLHSVALGDNFTGVTICFAQCQTDWTWTYQISMLPTVAGIPGSIEVLPHPTAGSIQVATCLLPDYPLEDMIMWNNLGLNQDCAVTVGTENVSWGAIKSLFK